MRIACIGLMVWVFGTIVSASGPIGFYGLIDKVVFEPNEAAVERLQVWGAFAYVDGANGLSISPARRGYLYFQLSPVAADYRALVLREWADLKTVAGTGQAVGFGSWTYIARFDLLQPDARPTAPSGITLPIGGPWIDLRVRPSTEVPANPAT